MMDLPREGRWLVGRAVVKTQEVNLLLHLAHYMVGYGMFWYGIARYIVYGKLWYGIALYGTIYFSWYALVLD